MRVEGVGLEHQRDVAGLRGQAIDNTIVEPHFAGIGLLDPGNEAFIGLVNYEYFLTDPAFFTALGNTLKLVGGILVLTVVGGILFALLLAAVGVKLLV